MIDTESVALPLIHELWAAHEYACPDATMSRDATARRPGCRPAVIRTWSATSSRFRFVPDGGPLHEVLSVAGGGRAVIAERQ
jgi:hypothetical protein